MLTRRVIVCLDVKGARVVKGVQFVGLRDVGDPVALATRYEAEGADEITFLDISASAEERATLLDVARRTAEQLFIPLTIGGGVRTADDVAHCAPAPTRCRSTPRPCRAPRCSPNRPIASARSAWWRASTPSAAPAAHGRCG
jgi:hypothetical protein